MKRDLIFILEKSVWLQYGAYIRINKTGGENTVKKVIAMIQETIYEGLE